MTATAFPTTTALYADTRVKASARIISYLTTFRGNAYSNTDIARALSLPQDSVRRVINELRAAGRVVSSVISGREWTIA
jgi:DNA-binding IclR family transcriptional regulator